MTTIQDLLTEKRLSLALLPPENPAQLPFGVPLTLFLIADDYPARSARIWNAAFRSLGVEGVAAMLVADPKDAERIMHVFKHDPHYRGGGAGIGFKEAVIPFLDDLTPIARAMGAVNSIQKTASGTLIGHNTDGIGYVYSLERLLEEEGRTLAGSKVLMIGAGGTGRAIAFALARKDVELTIVNRTERTALDLAAAVNEYAGTAYARAGSRELIATVFSEQNIVISVTDDAHSPLDEYSTLGAMVTPATPESVRHNWEQAGQLLKIGKPGLIVSDIRIRATETPMLAQARAHHFRTLDGIPMVVNQAADGLWWMYGDELTQKGVAQDDVARAMRS